ncbi:protein adenylyltransferase Fic [Enterococcus timonensis]|uniref:protein adenylyltransferase Fic n=1 Tax=Enterococcus timonensis TaxID=1852364 RepID=UPI0008DA0E3D|nr:Fic family protein [Enterococcus timonensis]
MVLENKLGINDSAQLRRQEELLTKRRVKQMFETGQLNQFEVGTFKGLSEIHDYIFQDVYKFAGQMRSVNIAKDQFRFSPVVYLKVALANIDQMPQNNFDNIVEKYVEMNVAHPFREGNGRSMRIWLDLIFKKSLGKIIDWNAIDKDDYLMAMQRSPIKDIEIKHLLRHALVDDLSKETFFKGVDASYNYEGYYEIKTEDLDGEFE